VAGDAALKRELFHLALLLGDFSGASVSKVRDGV